MVKQWFARIVGRAPIGPTEALVFIVTGGGTVLALGLGIVPKSTDPVSLWVLWWIVLAAGVALLARGLWGLVVWVLGLTGRSIQFVRSKAGSVPRIRIVIERPDNQPKPFGKPVEPVPWAGQVISETGGHYEIADPRLPPKQERAAEPTEEAVEALAEFLVAQEQDVSHNIFGSPNIHFGIRQARIIARQQLRRELADEAKGDTTDE